MTFTPTAEQLEVVRQTKETSDNLIIHALAGAAKTSTLVLIAKAQPTIPTLCLAFNKKIQLEMRERLPGNCEALTLNSLGHRTWANAISNRIVIQSDKTYRILSGLIEQLGSDDKTAAYERMADTIRAIDFGKSCGYVPTGHFPLAKGLIDDDELFEALSEEPTPLIEALIREATIVSHRESLLGVLDYNDQILMPTCFHGTFPAQYKLILVDEAQDLSALNHAMLRKLARKSRVIAVGDENQSIYGFRGAHQDSMNLLRKSFSMTPLTLSITFRCPQAVVKEARWRTPAMQWPDTAAEGSVTRAERWSASTLPSDAVILARNNSTVFSGAIALLRNGTYPEIVGNDIGKALIKIMKKLGPLSTPAEDALILVDEWVMRKSSISRELDKVHDQASCMKLFLGEGPTLGDAIAYAEHIMAVSGTIKLMTIHKAKGLEWNNVYILDRQTINLERVQEKNLLYVAQTRAKQSLTYITMGKFEGV